MTTIPPHHDITQRTMLIEGDEPRSHRSACLVVIHGEGIGRRIDLVDEPVVIGRSQDADFLLAHASVSRRHCGVWRDGDNCCIRDLGATNPTRVNGTKLIDADQMLEDGDQITVGDCILKFIREDSVEARYHEEIYQLATHDPLTGLCNRRHFEELADKEIARALRQQRPATMCIIDVDWFKPINDRFGHHAGDEVLRQIASLINAATRKDDLAGRIGGEEFALLLAEIDAESAMAGVERIRSAVSHTAFVLNGEPHAVTVSIGVAALTPARSSRSALMAAADQALYRAKHEGRNRIANEP